MDRWVYTVEVTPLWETWKLKGKLTYLLVTQYFIDFLHSIGSYYVRCVFDLWLLAMYRCGMKTSGFLGDCFFFVWWFSIIHVFLHCMYRETNYDWLESFILFIKYFSRRLKEENGRHGLWLDWEDFRRILEDLEVCSPLHHYLSWTLYYRKYF